MNLSKIMGSMTLRERRMLNEAVKQRIMEEESAAPAPAAPAPATEPSDTSPIGSTLSKEGKVVFELTEEGWKTTLRISEEQILALAIPAVKEELKKQMRAARGQGDELHIVKSSLTDPGAANKSNELFLKRDGEEFADPVEIPAAKMKTIMTSLGLEYVDGTDPNRKDTLAATKEALLRASLTAIGAAFVGFKEDGITNLLVPSDKLSGFDDLFGTSNSGKIELAIKKAADSKAAAAQKDAGKNPNEKYPESFKIPLSWAMDGSIMKYMSDSILRGVGIGKIEFKLDGENLTPGSAVAALPFYTASVKLNPKEIAALKAKLGARIAANASAP